jgi:hypothetical protein
MKPIDWKKLCRTAGLVVEGEAVHVGLPGDRGHRVVVRDEGETLELSGVVVGKKGLKNLEGAAVAAFRRNRTSQIVGFRIDARDGMVGEAWLSKHGLTAAELVLHVRSVAAECDRLEYLLTGKDDE